jgi:tetratricopeptide (TPR) repeat protein
LPGGKIALKLGFNANRAVPGAKIVVSDGEKDVFEETASLDPAVTWTHRIPDVEAGKSYTFVLSDAKGETILKHKEGVYDLVPRNQVHTGPQAESKPPEEKAWLDKDYLTNGTVSELQGDYLEAWEIYRRGLAKYPSSPGLFKAAGRLAVSLWRFEEASRLLAKAEEGDPSDPETHYYRGIAETALGHVSVARAELDAARSSPSLSAAGELLLAELLAREHDSAGALKLLEASCPASSGDVRCIEETVALKRTTGDPAGAKTLAAESLARYPTSLLLRNETVKLGTQATGPSGPDLDRHLAADTNRILNLVLQYNRLGLCADSLELLTRKYPKVAPEESEPAAAAPSQDSVLGYYRAFCREKLGQSAAADYAAASQMPLLYVFPNEPDEIVVLRAALAANPNDASAHFLLGSLWFSKGIVDPALEEWKRAESLNPKIPSLQASLGRALLEVKKQPAEAASEFQRGLQAEPGNAALYLGLDQAMREMGRTASQRADMMKTFPDPANMPAALVRALVDALRESHRDAEANAVLAHRFIPRKEGEAPLQPQK